MSPKEEEKEDWTYQKGKGDDMMIGKVGAGISRGMREMDDRGVEK